MGVEIRPTNLTDYDTENICFRGTNTHYFEFKSMIRIVSGVYPIPENEPKINNPISILIESSPDNYDIISYEQLPAVLDALDDIIIKMIEYQEEYQTHIERFVTGYEELLQDMIRFKKGCLYAISLKEGIEFL